MPLTRENEEKVQKIKAQFRSLDKNHDGGLSFREISGFLKKLNSNFSQHQLQQLFCEIDVNRNGRIEMNEFIDFLFSGETAKASIEQEPPSSTPSEDGLRHEWKKATLDEHNVRRRLHGAKPLAWSNECYLEAKKQANACQARGSLFHGHLNGPSGRHGQNAFWSSAQGSTAEEVVESWYSEIDEPGYDFNEPGFKSGTGHFTQVVWAETTHVGMAVSDCGHFVVANYLPAGNMMGAFADNVRAPQGLEIEADPDAEQPAPASGATSARRPSIGSARRSPRQSVSYQRGGRASLRQNRSPSRSRPSSPTPAAGESQSPAEVTASRMTAQLQAIFEGCPFDFETKVNEAFRRSSGATVTVRKEVAGSRTSLLVTIEEQHTTRQMRGSWGGG